MKRNKASDAIDNDNAKTSITNQTLTLDEE